MWYEKFLSQYLFMYINAVSKIPVNRYLNFISTYTDHNNTNRTCFQRCIKIKCNICKIFSFVVLCVYIPV